MGGNFNCIIILGLVLSLLVITGCLEKYVGNKISGDDITGDVVLNTTNQTQEEEEGCQEGYKECGKACIKAEDCCEDKDCSKGEECINFECISLEPDYCPFHMEWSADEGKCICEEGTKWCENRNKCIPELRCCSRFDCSRRDAEYCSPIYVSLRICVEN